MGDGVGDVVIVLVNVVMNVVMVLVSEEKMMVNVHVKVLMNDSNHQYAENLNTKADGRRVVRL